MLLLLMLMPPLLQHTKYCCEMLSSLMETPVFTIITRCYNQRHHHPHPHRHHTQFHYNVDDNISDIYIVIILFLINIIVGIVIITIRQSFNGWGSANIHGTGGEIGWKNCSSSFFLNKNHVTFLSAEVDCGLFLPAMRHPCFCHVCRCVCCTKSSTIFSILSTFRNTIMHWGRGMMGWEQKLGYL